MSTYELPFTAPALLAPMQGVTEPCFRDLVLRRNSHEALGGAFTEFVRVSRHPLPMRIVRAHLGPERHVAPVGLQVMGSHVDVVAATARQAEVAGAPVIDLNFGCPAKGAMKTCAGSALLDDPRKVEELVAACASVVERVPVTAKIRAGGEDDSRLEELASAAEAGGAALLTVHCRTRREAYSGDGDWERLRRAVSAVSIPVCGNGGVDEHADIERLRRETGCAYVMIGRAALADPWVFSGRTVERAEAARFLHDYAVLLAERDLASPRKVVGRIKQLAAVWTAGGLFDGDRAEWLRERDGDRILARLSHLADAAGVSTSERARVPSTVAHAAPDAELLAATSRA